MCRADIFLIVCFSGRLLIFFEELKNLVKGQKIGPHFVKAKSQVLYLVK